MKLSKVFTISKTDLETLLYKIKIDYVFFIFLNGIKIYIKQKQKKKQI